MKKTLLTLLCLSVASGARAAEDIRIRKPDQADFAAMTEDMTGAFSYKPLEPAEPMGIIGFQVGAMASYTGVENPKSWRNVTDGERFDQLALLGVTAGKGLFAGLDVGGFLAEVINTNVQVYGAELRYAVAEGGVMTPALSVRASYTRMTGADDIDFESKGLDVSISKGFLLLTPYVGMGRVWGEATPNGPNGAGLAPEEAHNNKLYAGVRIALTVLQINLEADQTGENSSYNLRVGVGF